MENSQRYHVLEVSAASGVVFVNIDKQKYWHSFKDYIKVWVVLNNEFRSIERNVRDMSKDDNYKSISAHFENSRSDLTHEDYIETFDKFDTAENFVIENDSIPPSFRLIDKKDEDEKIVVFTERSKNSKKHENSNRKENDPIPDLKVGSPAKEEYHPFTGSSTLHLDQKLSAEETRLFFDQEEKGRDKGRKIKRLEIDRDVYCEFCSTKFNTLQEFYEHRKSSRTEHMCEICQKVYPFKAHLLVHMHSHKANDYQDSNMFNPSDTSDVNRIKSSSAISKKDITFSSCKTSLGCEFCGIIMSNRSTFKTHMMRHTKENAYCCCVCGKNFDSIGRFTHHMSTHRRIGAVLCKVCNIGFQNRSELSKHQLTHKYKCSLCGSVFPNKTSRNFHYKISHKNDILKCPNCDKLYSSDQELKLHLKYHQTRRKIQCTICGRLVSRIADHMSSHSDKVEEGAVTYICDKCPKQFKVKLCFQRHLKTHLEDKLYACTHCPKRFVRSASLSRHMLTHTQEKPFVCSVCGKACTQMCNLKSHMQIHKNSGLHYCTLCEGAFSDKSNLHQHMKKIHGLE